MSEEQINELLEEIAPKDKPDYRWIDCSEASGITDYYQYNRIVAAIKQTIELLQRNEELTKKLEEVESQRMESLLQIENLLKDKLDLQNTKYDLLESIRVFFTNDKIKDDIRISDYVFHMQNNGIVVFKYEPIKEVEPIKLEILISENSGKYNVCPICNKEIGQYPAISRKDNKTEICSNCGMLEALEAFHKANKEIENEQKEV